MPETIYLAVGRATVLERLGARSHENGDDYARPAALAAAYFDHFEPP